MPNTRYGITNPIVPKVYCNQPAQVIEIDTVETIDAITIGKTPLKCHRKIRIKPMQLIKAEIAQMLEAYTP